MNKRILITGANGYIGKNLLKELSHKDYELVALVRDIAKMPSWLLGSKKIKIVEGDLLDGKVLKKVLEGIDVVIHLAASLRMFQKNKEPYLTNIDGLKKILSACKETNRPINFVFASSIDAIKRDSEYGFSKKQGEKIVAEYSKKNPNIDYTIVRIGNVYGAKEGGMVEGIKDVIARNNWRSSLLYHTLGTSMLYPVKMKNVVNKLGQIAEKSNGGSKMITLVDETISVKELVRNLKKQKLIYRYPEKLPLDGLFLKCWQLLGKALRKGDLLVYLSLHK